MRDTIYRDDAIRVASGYCHPANAAKELAKLPSATEESFEWCKECKEYDTEQHCCHRWTKVIRNTVEELTEQKIGNWIPCENETGEGSNTYKCSACGEIQMMIDGTPKENGWTYCPHCGAKME